MVDGPDGQVNVMVEFISCDCENIIMLKTVKMDSANTENTCVVGSPYATGPLSSCLSVTLVYCGQTFGWIKVKLGVEVGLCPGHIVLDGDPHPLPKGAQTSIFDPSLLWSNGWMDQDATWYGGRPQSRRHRVRWGLSYCKGAQPQFSAHVYIVARVLDGSRCDLVRR